MVILTWSCLFDVTESHYNRMKDTYRSDPSIPEHAITKANLGYVQHKEYADLSIII